MYDLTRACAAADGESCAAVAGAGAGEAGAGEEGGLDPREHAAHVLHAEVAAGRAKVKPHYVRPFRGAGPEHAWQCLGGCDARGGCSMPDASCLMLFVKVFPREVFYPYGWWEQQKAAARDFGNAYAVHHWQKNWGGGWRQNG